jgi:alpha-beta hydrolase superfamily lysophospholipase
MGILRRTAIAVAAAAAPVGLAYRFALAYRVRAGYPRRNPPLIDPSTLGLPFEATVVRSAGLELPAWFIPARDGKPGPGVVLVHGWESARDRTLPMARFLHAAGFHCLTFDVRGHGANGAEDLPMTGGEFGDDATAAFRTLMERPEVTVGAIAGHSMGAIGAILAAAADPRVAGLVATSGPADPYRLTRQTFRLAHLPIPDPIAYPLAWLTTRVYLRPRGHQVPDISSTAAIARYRGPVLLAHGSEDAVMPVGHLALLAAAVREARAGDPGAAPVETLVVAGGQHSWLYEDPGYRRAVARMLTLACDGPLDPETAGEIAAATPAERIPDAETRFAAMEERHGGLRTLAQVALPGATRVRTADVPTGANRDAPDGPEPGSMPARMVAEP